MIRLCDSFVLSLSEAAARTIDVRVHMHTLRQIGCSKVEEQIRVTTEYQTQGQLLMRLRRQLLNRVRNQTELVQNLLWDFLETRLKERASSSAMSHDLSVVSRRIVNRIYLIERAHLQGKVSPTGRACEHFCRLPVCAAFGSDLGASSGITWCIRSVVTHIRDFMHRTEGL